MAVTVIAKLTPKNDAFTGLVDASQVIGGVGNTLPDAAVAASNVTQHAIALSLLTEIGDILYASGVGAASVLPHGNAGEVLTSGGHGAAPSWAAAGGTDVDDTPVDGDTDSAISSNWAYDHVAATNPHTGYILSGGLAGGQTVKGDTASGGSLTLMSTNHATKGSILFGTSAYDEVNNRLGIGTTTIPHAAGSCAKFAIDGVNGDSSGPHIEVTTATDNYPLLQILNWEHDAVYISFDAYYSTAATWKSSDAGSNFRIAKNADKFKIDYDSGIAAGSALTWDTALEISNAGVLTVANLAGTGLRPVYASAAGLLSAPAYCAFHAYAANTTTVPTATRQKILHDGELYDYGGVYDQVNDQFVAPYNGIYHFDAGVQLDDLAADKYWMVSLKVDDGSVTVRDGSLCSNSVMVDPISVVSADLYLTTGQTVVVTGIHIHGSDRTALSGAYRSYFCGHLVLKL